MGKAGERGGGQGGQNARARLVLPALGMSVSSGGDLECVRSLAALMKSIKLTYLV